MLKRFFRGAISRSITWNLTNYDKFLPLKLQQISKHNQLEEGSILLSDFHSNSFLSIMLINSVENASLPNLNVIKKHWFKKAVFYVAVGSRLKTVFFSAEMLTIRLFFSIFF